MYSLLDISPTCETDSYSKSFMPPAMCLLNEMQVVVVDFNYFIYS